MRLTPAFKSARSAYGLREPLLSVTKGNSTPCGLIRIGTTRRIISSVHHLGMAPWLQRTESRKLKIAEAEGI
jgi:hypothetical protein